MNDILLTGKHVYDGDKVILNLDELIQMAACAVANSRTLMNRLSADIDNELIYCNDVPRAKISTVAYAAKRLAEEAAKYAQAFDCYHALMEVKHRSETEIKRSDS